MLIGRIVSLGKGHPGFSQRKRSNTINLSRTSVRALMNVGDGVA